MSENADTERLTPVPDLLPLVHDMVEPDLVERYADLMRSGWFDWHTSNPVTVESGILLDGTHRVLAAAAAGIETIPVVWVQHNDGCQAQENES